MGLIRACGVSIMKVDVCAFSGFKIYPGHGMRVIKADGRAYQFINAKCAKAHLAKRNPREGSGTVLYRRKNRKGLTEEISKKRTRRTAKFTRAITGASVADIMAKRNQKPEVRKAQREQAIRAFKEKEKQKKATKQAVKPVVKAPKPKLQTSKAPASKPRVGGKR